RVSACAARSHWCSATSRHRRRCWPRSNSAPAKTSTAAANTRSNKKGTEVIKRARLITSVPFLSADDVALQLVQFQLLVLDHRLDQVADGHDSEHAAAVDHRQVADALVGDQLHATVGGVVQPDRDDFGGHDLAHRR